MMRVKHFVILTEYDEYETWYCAHCWCQVVKTQVLPPPQLLNCLTNHCSTSTESHPWELTESLASKNPAPFL